MEFLEAIRDELVQVEEGLRRETSSFVPLINEVAEGFLQAGGKRLRPAMLLLSHRACGGESPEAVHYAVAMELIHSATLFHDDVVDEGSLRRGAPTPRAQRGNGVAVLIGDYLYSQAIRMLLEGSQDEINRALVEATLAMTEGEVLQLQQRFCPGVTREEYFQIIRRKTAGLMSACCRAGALVAGADRKTVEALSEYGQAVGMAFQIVDDLLDFTAPERVLGKQPGSDLTEGSVTLPVIELLERLPPAEAEELAETIRRREPLEPDGLARLRVQLEEEGCLTAAREKAESLAQEACRELEGLPSGPDRELLRELARFVVQRER